MTNRDRIIIPGGSGQVGTILARHFHAQGREVVTLSRQPAAAPWRTVAWNGRDAGPWEAEIDGAAVVINLAGRSVNCRYNAANRDQIKRSRIDSTLAVGRAIAKAVHPPPVWMNASTATIYRHALDRPMDEVTGELGRADSQWGFSIDVATAWERAFFDQSPATPRTRKIALRSAMTMSPDSGGVFDMLHKLVRFGLGGAAGSGAQFVSWIHHVDFVRAIEFLLSHGDISGVVNVCSPNPLPNRDFMQAIRKACQMPIGLPATEWMLEIGAVFLRTETELILKSRRVVPRRLLDAGFDFCFPDWPSAAADLCN